MLIYIHTYKHTYAINFSQVPRTSRRIEPPPPRLSSKVRWSPTLKQAIAPAKDGASQPGVDEHDVITAHLGLGLHDDLDALGDFGGQFTGEEDAADEGDEQDQHTEDDGKPRSSHLHASPSRVAAD